MTRFAPQVLAFFALVFAVMAVAGVYRSAILEFVGPRVLADQGIPGVSFTVTRFGADSLKGTSKNAFARSRWHCCCTPAS